MNDSNCALMFSYSATWASWTYWLRLDQVPYLLLSAASK